MATVNNTIPRDFNCKDSEMLTTSSEITVYAQSLLPQIVAKRPTWKDPFFPDLLTRINNAFNTYLGVDNAADLRKKTDILLSIMKPAQADLSTFKINITADFKNDKPRLQEILTLLGYNQYWKQVQNDDEEACIQMLYRFQNNMTAPLRTEITDAGTSNDLITTILTYPDTLNQANISQEFSKSLRPVATKEAIVEFNAIYNTIISICTICRNIFIKDPVIRNNFSFSAVKKRLNATKGTTPTPPTS